MKPASLEDARAAKGAAVSMFAGLAELAGVGITRSETGYALKVNLVEAPAAGVRLPTEIHGVPVKVAVVGPVKARLAA